MGKFFIRILLGLFLSIFFVACSLPVRTPDPAATLRAVFTGQASTLPASQTRVVSPVIPSSAPTITFPTPPATIVIPSLTSILPTHLPTQIPVSLTPNNYCNWAAYVKDVSVPDGSVFAPGEKFTKIWKFQNIGTCPWTKSYQIVFVSGNLMQASTPLEMPARVNPGKSVEIAVDLKAPSAEGSYRGYWLLRSSSGSVFGLGTGAATPFYVDIVVATPITTMLNFATSYCEAVWRSGAGVLGCPGDIQNKNGYATRVENPQLENGQVFYGQGLLVAPEKVTNGYIQGYYPAYSVHSGDRFRALINCAYLATGCYAVFRLDYQIADGPVKTIWQFTEAYEGQYYKVDIDLSPLSGNTVKFILTVLAVGSPDFDKLVWVAPRIERPSNLVTASATMTQSPTTTRTSTPTSTHTVTPTYTATATATQTSTLTVTLTPTATATETPTISAFLVTMTPTETPTVTATP